MLCISRKSGERLILSDAATSEVIAEVIVSQIAGNRVTLAVEAPDEVRILRGELKPTPPSELQPFVAERLAVNGD